ncbi:MAG: alpha/beta fold hydrolase [Thermoanaerobaculia bacterium]
MQRKLLLLLLLIHCSTATPPGLITSAEQVESSRRSLARSGLARKTLGTTVYWASATSDRPVLVLLHGANEQAGTWASVVPLLGEFRLIIPDLAGHGESAPATGPIAMDAMVDAISSVIDHEAGGRKVILAGNSLGGWLSMLYAFDHPERVERLVLENASGMFWRLNVPLYPKTREEAALVMRAVHGPNADTSEATLDALLARKDTPMSRIALPDALAHLVDARLGELKMPITLIWGRHDGVLPVAYAEALHAKLPGSTLTIIEDAAHIPHRQSPRKFAQCLKTTC